MKQPKVLVGDTVNAGIKPVLGAYLGGLLDLSYRDKEIFLLDNSPEEGSSNIFNGIDKIKVTKTEHLPNGIEMIVRDRNVLRKHVLDNGFDYLLLIGYSQLPPTNVVEKLMEAKKDVVSALCFREVVNKEGNELYVLQQPMIAKSIQKEGKQIQQGFTIDEVFPSRLMKADYCTFGCILLSRKVLEKIEFRHDERNADHLCFCEDLKKNKFELWIDTGVVCKNLNYDRKLFL